MSIAPRDAKCSIAPATRARAQRGSDNVVGFALVASNGVPQTGQSFGNFHGFRPLRALGQHRPDDLGDHVARLAHDHGVAGPHVFGLHLVFVVQRGDTDGGATDEHRLEHCERRGLSGAPDRHHDVLEQRGAFLGRELVGDGPAWRLPRGAERGAQRQVVDLHHDAVDLVGQIVAVLLPALAELVAPRRGRARA